MPAADVVHSPGRDTAVVSPTSVLDTAFGMARGLAAETFWIGWTGVRALTGAASSVPAFGGRLVQTDPGDGRPIVLVHGVGDSRSVFAVVRNALRRAGLGPVYAYEYAPTITDLRATAAGLGRHVAELRRTSGRAPADPIALVGHSLGGLIGRCYVQLAGGAAGVSDLVTLGTPHRGMPLADVVLHPVARQLRPGSPLFRALAAPAPGVRTRITVVASDLDALVPPDGAGHLVHPDLDVRRYRFPDIGHWSLPMDPRVAAAIATALAAPPLAR